MQEFLRLLLHPRLRKLLAVRWSGQLTDGIFQSALASFVLFSPERQASAMSAALGFTVVLLPYSIVGPFVGTVLDKFSRQRIAFYTNLFRVINLIFISLIALGLGYKSIAVFIGFNAPSSFEIATSSHSIRVVSWNVARFIEPARNNNTGSATRKKMLTLLREQQADVLCLQEFYTSDNPAFYNNIRAIQQELGFRYYYFPFE